MSSNIPDEVLCIIAMQYDKEIMYLNMDMSSGKTITALTFLYSLVQDKRNCKVVYCITDKVLLNDNIHIVTDNSTSYADLCLILCTRRNMGRIRSTRGVLCVGSVSEEYEVYHYECD